MKKEYKNFILNIFRPEYTITKAAEKAGITRQRGHQLLNGNDDILKYYNYIAGRIDILLKDIEDEK